MKCKSCNKEVKNGYFWEGSNGVNYICTGCLLSYNENRMHKYDHEQIMRMHRANISVSRICELLTMNPITVQNIIRQESKNEQRKKANNEAC